MPDPLTNFKTNQPMKYAFAAYLFLSFALVSQSGLALENDGHPVVPGFERFANVETISDAERGMLLLNELNCMSCHQSDSSWSVLPKQAPILTDVGSRILPQYFESFLLDPQAIKPGTTMPKVLSGKPEAEQKKIAESIAHFLASTGQAIKQNSRASFVREGDRLFHSIGCVACHDPQNADVKIATSIPLGELENKFTLPALTEFIKNPLPVRPSGRMPQFNLAGNEAQSIAAYLLRDAVVESKINFACYEGNWDKLPDFSKLKPVSTGIADGFDMNVSPKNDHFGIVYTGYWETKKDAKYRFRISSDDGSKLMIDGQLMVVNDGVHGVTSVEKEHVLPAGVHEVRVEFFEKQGGEELRVAVFGGGLEGVELGSLMRATAEEAVKKDADAFVHDLDKAAIGKQYFQSVGCASCHEMKFDDAKLVSTSAIAKRLTDLEPTNGCLAGSAISPSFELSPFQIRCIATAIDELKNPKPLPTVPEQLVHEKFVTLNCYACHNRQMADRSIRGGVVDARGDSVEIYGRKDWFTGTQVEMGDEGQHPPSLTSIGSKLKPEWFDNVLRNGVKDRSYMHTRMPKFGIDNLGPLSQELISLDRLTNVPEVTQTIPARKVKAHGRFFAGEEALSCIKCHNFGKYPATGVQAIDLTTMTKRLDKDWFRAYMLKPSDFRRGTRMPESWPGGKSQFPDILDGDTYKQIDSIWEFLSDGENAAKPKGLVRSKMELKAVETPKIYRNFIEGAGPRAIGVGYPEQVNLAFDAELCRMAILWQENFIDASRHWSGRGQGFEAPLGENVLRLPESVVFSTSLNTERWSKDKPGNRPKFKGYRFDNDRRPVFVYQLGDVTIEDQPIPYMIGDRPLLKRKFKITSTSTKKLYYLAARSEKTIEIDGGMAFVDSRLRTGIDSVKHPNVASEIEPNGNVVFTIDLSRGPVDFEQIYDW